MNEAQRLGAVVAVVIGGAALLYGVSLYSAIFSALLWGGIAWGAGAAYGRLRRRA